MSLITASLKCIRNRIYPMPEPLEGITVIEMTIAIQGSLDSNSHFDDGNTF